MNIDLTDEQAELAKTSRRFLATTMPTTEVRARAETASGFDRAWWQRCAELGWTFMLVSGEDGPTAGVADLVVVAEEVGRAVAPGPLLPSNVVAWAVANAALPATSAAYLDGLVDGTLVGAWAFAERSGSWDPRSVATVARRDGGGLVLDGVKSYVEAGGEADVILCTARDEAGELVQVLVTPEDAGVTVRALEGIDLVRRFAEIELVEVRVGAERVLSASSSTAADVDRQLEIAVALECASMVGAVDRVFEFSLEWAFDRYSFGRPLASYQALKHRYADMKMRLEACHAAATAAAEAVATAAPDAGEKTSIAKAYIGEHAPEIVQDCVQMHGGIGVTWEHDIHLYLRRVALGRALYGDPAAHRQRVADLLGV